MPSERGPLHLVARGEAARCAVCHDALDEATRPCEGCGVALHDECRAATSSCPTLGCDHARVVVASPCATKAGARAAPGALTAIVCLALAGASLLVYIGLAQAAAIIAGELMGSTAASICAAAGVTLVTAPLLLACVIQLERISSGRR